MGRLWRGLRSTSRAAWRALVHWWRRPRLPAPKHRARLRITPREALHAAASESSFERKWARLVFESAHDRLLGELVGTTSEDPDAALRILLPQLGDKVITDQELRTPAAVPYEQKDFPSREVGTPIDWSADPLGVRDDRLWLQSLSWIDALYTPGGKGLWRAAYVVVDWHDRALAQEPPLELTWNDHAMSARFDRTWRFLMKYIEVTETPNRRVLHGAVTIVLSHLYGLAVDSLYGAGHNHGLMQDRTLLIGAQRLPALLDAERLSELAERRLLEHQVRKSVTGDFIHTENSPGYQWMYVRVLTGLLSEAYAEHGRTPPTELCRIRDGLLDSLVYLLQPNLTAPQFGDSLNGVISRELRLLIHQATASVPIDPLVRERATYLISHGTAGVEPPMVDRVFFEGGYAAFREGWGGEAPNMRITGHFKCSRLTSIHYHQDETSFEIYGYGEELVVNPGRYHNDRTHPLTQYGASAHAHNVLIVDGEGFGSAKEPSRIVGSGGDAAHVWVQGAHGYYRGRGVQRIVRTFAYLKPNVFLVLDAVETKRMNRLEQHFHLHPSFTRVDPLPGGGVRAERADGVGLVLVPCDAKAHTRMVVGDQGPEQSWYFPVPNEAKPSTDVVIRRDASAGTHYVATLLVVTAAGDPLERLHSIVLDVGAKSIDLQFRFGERAHHMTIETGPFG